MARTIHNPGSAPIYREMENLLLLSLNMVERAPKSVGIRRMGVRIVDTLLDCLTIVGFALNEKDIETKLEYINSVFLQMRLVKTCIDTMKEWSNDSRNVRVISNKQMPCFAASLHDIFNQVSNWRGSTLKQRDS